MKHLAIFAAAALVAAPAMGQSGEPLALRGMGSFHVGGHAVEVSGQPVREAKLPDGRVQKVDPNGSFLVEHMYVQYFLPAKKSGKFPMLMWHGGGLTGVTYETTPDGREGWANLFLRKGWDVYVSDSVERGRSGFAEPEIFKGEPVFATQGFAWDSYRIGAPGSFQSAKDKRVAYPGTQFPVDDYENLVRQLVPRWLTTDEAILSAYVAEIDRVGPCVLVVHSQSGTIAYRAALARPDKVKAIVDVEGTLRGDATTAAAVKHIPILVIYGDNVEKSEFFARQHAANLKMADIARSVGGSVEIVELPVLGMKGNSHFLMMEKNNAQIADIIQEWLVRKGLTDAAK